jgi:hypothetical protein
MEKDWRLQQNRVDASYRRKVKQATEFRSPGFFFSNGIGLRANNGNGQLLATEYD